jgi:hypothetical protein
MKILYICSMVSAAAILPAAAFAQTNTANASASDAKYCAALSHQYQKYVSSAEDRHPQGTPANVTAAMTKCQSGDAASAIPVLENALKDQKVDLPPRS